MYNIFKIRQGFWAVSNIYNERLYEGCSFAECKRFIERLAKS